MLSPLYPKLAWTTMIRDRRMTFPFVLGIAAMTGVFYAITALCATPGLKDLYGGDTIKMILELGQGVIAFLLPILYFYVNSFVARSRGKEMGLFTTLGMERRHLVLILFWQMLYLFAASTVFGLLLGLLTEKLSWLLLQNLTGSLSNFDLYVGPSVIWHTIAYTGLVYFGLFLYTAWTTLRKDPLEQMKSEARMERPPKARWLLAIAGLACLGAGYGMALTIKDPLAALNLFFVAVILVIIGTYLFFLFGITVLLHVLKNRQGYYYDPRHFFSVSSLQFRIKSNAASLATICILSTMILVTMTTTLTVGGLTNEPGIPGGRNMMISSALPGTDMENQALSRYEAMKEIIAPYDASNQLDLAYFVLGAKADGQDIYVAVISQKDAARLADAPVDLPGSAVVYDPEGIMGSRSDMLDFKGISLPVVYTNEKLPVKWTNAYSLYMICDDDVFEQLLKVPDMICTLVTIFDAPGADKGTAFEKEIVNHAGDAGFYYAVDSARGMQDFILALTGGLIFIGVFVSMIIFAALVLVLYYRQISEGVSDQRRFAIMQDLGMEKRQVMGLINSQAVLMFFLPLAMAAIHLAFASGFLQTILIAGFGLTKSAYWTSFLVVLAVYALIYLVVYRITAQTYYSIVRKAESA